MPPKKATATKAKATPAKAPAATAASERPRRAAAEDAPAPTPAKKAAVNKTPAKKAPAKAAATTTHATPRKRGRPAKTEQPEADADEPPKKKRGRPAKAATSSKEDQAVPEAETAPPKKRGRPPKGGETTKINEDDPAAAEQLEEELVDAAEVNEDEGTSKRASPTKKGKPATKSRGRKAKVVAEDAAVDDADRETAGEAKADLDKEADDEAGGKQYWLMKAEQIDREELLQDGSVFNAKFTIDDLRAAAGPEPWDGVRNPTACKNMREMRLGDLAFFYASGGKGKSVQPGIAGVMEIVKEHEPDMSAFDEKHPYYVQNAKMRGTKANPRWSLVHVEFRKKLSKPVGLKELQQYKHDSGVLANMQEFTAARLSVSKVTPKEWAFIVDNLIEGYDDEGTPSAVIGDQKQEDNLAAATTKFKDATTSDVPVINGATAGDEAIPTLETAGANVEVNGSSSAPSQKLSSRPTSRAPSRVASRASSKGPSRPVSQGSLAPLLAQKRAQSRGRSRTPASRTGSVKPLTGVAEEMETVVE